MVELKLLVVTLITTLSCWPVTANWINSPSKYDNGTWICDRPWPEIELFLPLATHYSPRDSRYYEYETLFLRSFLLFWPQLSNSSLRLLFDKERAHGNYYSEILGTFNQAKPRLPGKLHISLSEPSEWYHRATDRQQLMMMWADNFTSSEYVAFTDSDTVFLTAIDREDLFEDGKPVINGRAGPHDKNDFWSTAPSSTFDILRLNETMRCMSYFPVIIKTRHLADLRKHVIDVHGGNRTFDDIFKEVTSRHHEFFQFNAICTFAFNYKREEYRWYAHPMVRHDWDGTRPHPNAFQIRDFSVFDDLQPSVFEPKPRVATHGRYRSFTGRYMGNIVLNRIHMNLLLQQGICLSPPLVKESPRYNSTHTHRDDPVCEHVTFAQKPPFNGIRTVKELGYYEEQHIFEYFDWTNVVSSSLLKQQHDRRMTRIGHCAVQFDRSEYNVIMKVATEMSNSGWGR